MVESSRVKRLRQKSRVQKQTQEQVAMKAVGYVRVSTEEQVESGHGMESQERAIRSFVESQGYELVDIILDAGVSGAKRPEDREGFRRVLELADQQAFSVMLVWKFDRLARNLTYAVTSVNTLREQYNVVLRSVTEPIDTSTPMGETIFAVLAGMAAQERRSITERTLAGKREKANQGGFAGGASPLGYKRDKEGGLTIDEDEAEVVRRIYSMRRTGATLQAIADALNQGAVRTKRGGQWYPGTVRYILDNNKYKGYVEYYFTWEGEAYVMKSGAHEPIIGGTMMVVPQ